MTATMIGSSAAPSFGEDHATLLPRDPVSIAALRQAHEAVRTGDARHAVVQGTEQGTGTILAASERAASRDAVDATVR